MTNVGDQEMIEVVERAPSLRVQSVLYGNSVERLKLAVDHLERAADLAIAAGSLASVELVWGDSSPQPALDATVVNALARHCMGVSRIGYQFFDRNLGSAGGHNRLLENVTQDCVLFMNPDVMLAPNALIELARPLRDARTGLVEARQLPVEHPKDYSRQSGETSWATTACALVRTVHLSKLNGFDAESFFLYCDDVDLSWRLRLEGLKIIFQPSAVVFHDKRLSEDGRWMPSEAEKYYSAEAALMLAQKYSREDIARRLVRDFLSSEADYLKRAATTFEQRRAAGKLPTPLDPNHLVSEFVDGLYTRHRFPL